MKALALIALMVGLGGCAADAHTRIDGAESKVSSRTTEYRLTTSRAPQAPLCQSTAIVQPKPQEKYGVRVTLPGGAK